MDGDELLKLIGNGCLYVKPLLPSAVVKPVMSNEYQATTKATESIII